MYIHVRVCMDACTLVCARAETHTQLHTQFHGAAKYDSALIPSTSSGN